MFLVSDKKSNLFAGESALSRADNNNPIRLANLADNKFKNSDLFVVTNPSFSNFKKILDSVKKTKNIYLFDDSRSQNRSLNDLEISIRKKIKRVNIKTFYRTENIKRLYPNSDNYLKEFEID